MMLANATRSRQAACVVLVVSLGAAWGWPRGSTNNRDKGLYTHGRIHVSDATAKRWDEGEQADSIAGAKIQTFNVDSAHPDSVPFPGDPIATLTALEPSERHGASDKRMLSVLNEHKTFQGSGIIAQITLVKGSEYKSESEFKKWIPIAILSVTPDTFPAGKVIYPKLKLHGGTSWLYVREESPSKWYAALVRITRDKKIEQDPLPLSVSGGDNVEPVIGAQFFWDDNDETAWAYCGGKCCKVNPQ